MTVFPASGDRNHPRRFGDAEQLDREDEVFATGLGVVDEDRLLAGHANVGLVAIGRQWRAVGGGRASRKNTDQIERE